MENPPPQKKGLGPLAWIGIGCGGIVVLAVIGMVVSYFVFGPKLKEMATDMQKDPTRFAVTAALKLGGDKLEMVAEDEANKRYTVREKATGKLTTIYWSAKKNAPEKIEGDFSAIPAEDSAPAAPSPAPAPGAAEKN